MRRPHHRSVAGREQHRQAIGHLNRADPAGLRRDHRVGLEVGRKLRTEPQHLIAVYLREPGRFARQIEAGGDAPTIFGNGLRCIRHVRGEVQRCVGFHADPASAQGEYRAHVARHRPVRLQPGRPREGRTNAGPGHGRPRWLDHGRVGPPPAPRPDPACPVGSAPPTKASRR